MAHADDAASGPAIPHAARVDATGVDPINVELAWSPGPGEVQRIELRLPGGATVADALRAGPWWPDGLPAHLATAVWGKLAPLDRALRERDRVEVLRPLKVDPKEARRLRYRRQRDRAPR